MDLCEYNLVYDFSNIDNGIVYTVSPLYSVGSTSVSPPTTDGKYSGEAILESPQKQNCSLLQASHYSHNIYLSSIPGLGRSPGEKKGYPLQYSGLENSI